MAEPGTAPPTGPSSPKLTETRRVLHRLAVHVLGRRRYDVSGRFGLRSSPVGFATPAFGPGPEVLRVAGTSLVREQSAGESAMAIEGSTLRQLARFVETDIDAPFSAGTATPSVGDPDERLHVDEPAIRRLADWWALSWDVLDEVLTGMPASAEPTTIELWPEHFDAGTSVGLPDGRRLNLGFSPGDEYCQEPYAYIAPWSAERPGDPGFWNAPFGALRRASEVAPSRPRQDCLEFIRTGIARASTW